MGMWGSSKKKYGSVCGCPIPDSTVRTVTRELIKEVPKEGNPNPKNFGILKAIETDNYLIVKVNYPDCNNYEGNKIMVYKGVSNSDFTVDKIVSLDPHFCDNPMCVSPIARFEPTDKGWRMAEIFVKAMKETGC